MYFNKCDHPINFRFDAAPKFDVTDLGNGVSKLVVHDGARWEETSSQAELDEAAFSGQPSAVKLVANEKGFRFGFLSSMHNHVFGVSGAKWMCCFGHNDYTYYGLGEKNNGFEKSGSRTKFWNTDVMADFNMRQIEEASTDPMYVDVPYIIIKNGNEYAGILLDNPYAAFMSFNAPENFRPGQAVQYTPYFMFGSTAGLPTVYFLHGPTLPELCSKLQTLCGKHPRPPFWSIGMQQCRWGYKSPSTDLTEVDAKYRLNNIPLDGLWMDIDYMDQFRVFTFNPANFTDPKKEFGALQAKDRHCVVILDPGVSLVRGYETFERGLAADIYCKNTENNNYVGFVWPGATVFPDFSLPAARDWWADEVRIFLDNSGLDGFWVDMNDPATGASELDEMRFRNGAMPHESYHNQYALGMQRATFEGFRRHNPDKRPFIVSRSGYISTSRYSAIWTGDNISNYFHLRKSIEMVLNLSLSGIPFCGPDVPGFAQDPWPELAQDWYKAGFLFPFFRNHSAIGTKRREPWEFGEKTCARIAQFVRLRYRLLPYLYSLFIEHEANGAPILRPLFYEFADTPEFPLGKIDDQFMVGHAIMQAPFVDKDQTKRFVLLPGPGRWFDPFHNKWYDGKQYIPVEKEADTTPLFIREGALIPMWDNPPEFADAERLLKVKLGAYASKEFSGARTFRYVADDGATLGYRTRAAFTEAMLNVTFTNGCPALRVEGIADRAGKLWVDLEANPLLTEC